MNTSPDGRCTPWQGKGRLGSNGWNPSPRAVPTDTKAMHPSLEELATIAARARSFTSRCWWGFGSWESGSWVR